MDKMKIDILGISEMRWPKSRDFQSGDHKIIYTGASETKPGTGGVGIILNKTLGKKVKGYIQFDDRIILIKLQTKPKDTIVVQVYMPTSNSSDEEVEEVYGNIDKIIENVKGEENLVIMGDWNVVVGEEKVNNVTGAFGLGRRNERGEQLLEFCAKHNLIVTNTCFNQRRRRRYTWKIPGDINRYQIDYIMVKNRLKNQIKESRSYPGADIDSDHNLVMMKCELKFKRILDKKKKIVQWETKNLRDEKISKKYSEDTNDVIIEESKNIKERWQNLEDIITMATTKTLGSSNKAARKEWITTEIVKMIEERRKYKSLNSINGQEKYQVLRNLIVRESRKAKEKYLEEKCSEIETVIRTGSSDEAYRMV